MATHTYTEPVGMIRAPWLAVDPGEILITRHDTDRGPRWVERAVARVEISDGQVTYWTEESWADEPVSWTCPVSWAPTIRKAA